MKVKEIILDILIAETILLLIIERDRNRYHIETLSTEIGINKKRKNFPQDIKKILKATKFLF